MPEHEAPHRSASAATLSPPSLSPAAIIGLSQLRVESQTKHSEQQTLIHAERKADGRILLGKVINPDTAFSINIYPDPQRPEIKPQAIAAMLFNHVQSGPVSADTLQQITEKFISWRLERFLHLEEFGYQEDPNNRSQAKNLSAAELNKLAHNICLMPWHIINSPTESFITQYGAEELQRTKSTNSCVGVHTHPFFTAYSELNQLIAASRAEWSMDAIFDLFESSSAQQAIEALVKSKSDLLSRLLAAEQSHDLPLNNGLVTLDAHSQKILSELRSLAAEKMPHSAEYKDSLAEQIIFTRQAISALADIEGNPSPSAQQIKKLCLYGAPSLSGSLMPSPEDLNLAREQGRGKLLPSDNSFFEVIVNPLGTTVFAGQGEQLKVWQYDLTGESETLEPARLQP